MLERVGADRRIASRNALTQAWAPAEGQVVAVEAQQICLALRCTYYYGHQQPDAVKLNC